MGTDRSSSRLWEDAPPPAAEPPQLLFITIGVVDPDRSFLDLSLREYLELKERVTRALGHAAKVMFTEAPHGITVSAYGADANALWERCAPLMEVPELRNSVTVMRRFGGPGARELITRV